MTRTENAGPEPSVEIDDTVLAKIAAYEAAQTAGIARLHPYAIQAARDAVTSVARHAAAKVVGAQGPGTPPGWYARTGPGAVDPTAVDVDHDAGSGAVTLTIRVVASTTPPILQAVNEVQRRVNARITELVGTAPLVIVNILDVDPTPPASRGVVT